ncbi:unnamed protein product [Discula destructiva]
MLPRSSGTLSPNLSTGLQTGLGHSTPGVLNASASAGASPSTSSPTGNYGLSKIAVAQVSVLLSTLKTKQDDPVEYDHKVDRLKKLINDHGMEVFPKYFTKLVLTCAPQIFPGLNRPIGSAGNGGNYTLLQGEMEKIARDVDQATRISESIETGTEDIFRDFDLSTFMEHFRLNALEKTILALAFKMGNRADLKTKADAILSTNFPTFLNIISQPDGEHADLSPHFLAIVVDRLIQYHPPNFTPSAHRELVSRIESRYAQLQRDILVPLEILAALDIYRVLVDDPLNALVLYIHRTGPEFTRDEEACVKLLQDRPAMIEEQVSNALWYTTLSQSPEYNPSVLIAGVRRIAPPGFRWQEVIAHFDQPTARISPPQFLRLYRALLPVALEYGPDFDIQRLWSGVWANADAQLSFLFSFFSQMHEELDATTIPGLRPSFTAAEFAQSSPMVQELAAVAERHPLVSLDALTAVFEVALNSQQASTGVEAKRLFNEAVVPRLAFFFVSALGVPKPWSPVAIETVGSLVDTFFFQPPLGPPASQELALENVWRKDKDLVKQRLTDRHGDTAGELPLYFKQLESLGWLDEFTRDFNGFGLDLVTYGHGEGRIDLEQWLRDHAGRTAELATALLQFLVIKAKYETDVAASHEPQHTLRMAPLKIKTVFSVLNVLAGLLPPDAGSWILCQRSCMVAYPRVINYGGEYDDIIDANGKNGHRVDPEAEARMQLHFKAMYNDDRVQVKDIVEALDSYKHSRNPLDQDIFVCIIYGLFEEYSHFNTYPLSALATTAVLFGGVLSRRLIDGVPLNVGLGMVLESVRDYPSEHNMYKFGLQALIQLRGRLPEWPGYCRQLLQVPTLLGTDIWRDAESVVNEEDTALRGSLEGLTNGNATAATESQYVPFTSVNAEFRSPGMDFEEPDDDDQDKIQFALNNIDQSSLRSRFDAIRDSVARRHQQWFAIHLVEERAKMQPNLHQMYLELVKLFEDNVLWAEIQRATLVCVQQILNSESTMHNSTERAHLKNLGGWLGMLTLARDKPIRHQNIAFKQLLIEAYDTKRLVIVIPFVCKVLDQGKTSTVFRPPNPWLMDILHLLIELYHHAEIKLNQKFEIEVLCKNLNLDHKNIKASEDIRKHMLQEELPQVPSADGLDSFDVSSMNGLGQGIGSNLMPQAPEIPELRASLNIPPTNEMVVNNNHLRDIVDKALKQALIDIIQPVVDRSVTIAAISTQQMIHKDFATEPDENRVRNCAINMVKATAGSLALVTSKEPLRANFTNQMRQLSSDIVGGLPEGTIIMCVNSNLDLASGVIENAAEKRAIPEIEELIEPELEARRRHRSTRPGSAYVDTAVLSRWAMTMPDPYKLSPNQSGLNLDQMAIYEEFARQPRPVATTTTPSHIASTSDATRSIANEVLSDQYSSVPGIPTPAETPSLPSVAGHVQGYPHGHAVIMNGRQPAGNVGNASDPIHFQRRMKKFVEDLKHAATEAPEVHYDELPRGQAHPVIDIMDEFGQLIIATRSNSDVYATETTEAICEVLLGPVDDNLTMETFAKLLQTLRRIAGPQVSDFAKNLFQRQEASRNFLRLPLIKTFMGTEFLDWRTLDEALARHIRQKDHMAMLLLNDIVQMTIINDMPVTFFANLGNSVEAAYYWILEDAEGSRGQHLKSLLEDVRAQQVSGSGDRLVHEQMDYVFEEWVNRYRNTVLNEKLARGFIKQMQEHGIVRSKDDFFLFIRISLDSCAAHYEQALHAGVTFEDAYVSVDALAKLIVDFARWGGLDDNLSPISLLESIWALVTMLVNLHTVKQAEMFNQRVFFRFFSNLIFESKAYFEVHEAPLWAEMLVRIAGRLSALGPSLIPGFVYGWMALISHRGFLPDVMRLSGEVGWTAYTRLVKQLLGFVGEALKPIELDETATKLYEAAAKMLIVLQHDYPEYLAANAAAILPSIPPHCSQLINTVLMAGPPNPKASDPFTTPMDAVDASQDPAAGNYENPIAYLQSNGLLDILNAALENGPSEDAVAHMTHAIARADGMTSFGHAPVGANIAVIDAVTAYIGNQAGQQLFDPNSPSVATLSMLLHEVAAEARHYLILSMINHLRRASPDMRFFSKFILHLFEQGQSDPEEMEILEQITRVLLERVIGFWPQPWGLLSTFRELVKNDRFNFFDLPFIKAAPDVRAALMQRGLMG